MKMIFTKHNKTFSHSAFMISCRLFINCQKAGFSKTKNISDALPSSILNLSNWKITIPFDTNGKDGSECGVAQEIKQTELNTYTQPNEVYPIIPPLLISKQDVKDSRHLGVKIKSIIPTVLIMAKS